MTAHPYTLTDPSGAAGRLGLIVLQTDEVIEQEFRRMFPDPAVAIYTTRIPSGAEVTAGSLAEMEAALPRSAGLLPPSLEFGAVGYACTSGATVIGPGRVAELVRGAAKTARVTDPLTATRAALAALGARRIGLVSPYVAEVSAALRAALTESGTRIAAFTSFDEAEEARVARIDAASISAAAQSVDDDADAVFLSCTNLRAVDFVADLEARLGKPVISSNTALAWHMARLANAPAPAPEFGCLMSATLQPGATCATGSGSAG